MLDHFQSLEFLQNTFWILVFSMLLVPFLYYGGKGCLGILASFGEQSKHANGEDAAYNGCAGCLVLVIFISILVYSGNWLVEKFVKMPAPAGANTNWGNKPMRELGPVVIFCKEAPLLYNYYQELVAIRAKEKSYITSLENERNQASSAPAKMTFDKQIKISRARLNELETLCSRIEELAGRLHFARYMADIGLHVDEANLQQELSHVTKAGSSAVNDHKSQK